jgi:oligopeptide/dipeptide ABC transporter ATP-binding protein
MTAEVEQGEPLLSVRGLKTWFPIRQGLLRRTVGQVRAVDGVDLDIHPGRTLALVGESGCGKTTVGRSILRLTPPTAGSVLYRGQDLLAMNERQLRPLRRKMQMVFQDPMTSLNPRMRVRDLLEEGLLSFGIGDSATERHERAAEALRRVQLHPDHLNRFPHEFSGGQRQRIGIARALIVEPELLICDEAVSALDVSIQAQVLNLLLDLQAELGVAYLFITHDLSVVRHLGGDVAVMYLGRIVETGPTQDVFAGALHPYTQGLLGSILSADPDAPRTRARVMGDVPSPADPPPACHFHTRCPHAWSTCRSVTPGLLVRERLTVRCHLYDETQPRPEAGDPAARGPELNAPDGPEAASRAAPD